MNEQELKKRYEAINGVWNLLKKFSNPTDEDAFWDELKQATSEFAKGDCEEFRHDIVIAVNKEIHRFWKNEKRRN